MPLRELEEKNLRTQIDLLEDIVASQTSLLRVGTGAGDRLNAMITKCQANEKTVTFDREMYDKIRTLITNLKDKGEWNKILSGADNDLLEIQIKTDVLDKLQ